jgi:hypothetical protein
LVLAALMSIGRVANTNTPVDRVPAITGQSILIVRLVVPENRNAAAGLSAKLGPDTKAFCGLIVRHSAASTRKTVASSHAEDDQRLTNVSRVARKDRAVERPSGSQLSIFDAAEMNGAGLTQGFDDPSQARTPSLARPSDDADGPTDRVAKGV